MIVQKYIIRIVVFTLMLIGQFLWLAPSAQAGCLCTGTIRGKYLEPGWKPADGPTTMSIRLDDVREIKDECLNDSSLSSIESCNTYINDKARDYSGITEQSKYDSFEFRGTCEVAQCGAVQAKDFKIRKPVLNIFIPDLDFSDIETTVDSNGNIQVPWIGEYIVAVYRLLINVASILGVILIIREGIRIILSAGGEGKMEGYQHIGRILIGLILAWFSYVILFNLNSSLVSIRPLNIRAVSNNIVNDVEESDTTDDATIKASIDRSNQNASKVSPSSKAVDKCPWKRDQITLAQCQEWKTSKSITFNNQKFTASNPCGAVPNDGRMSTFDSCLNPQTGQKELILDAWGRRKSVTVEKSMEAPLCRAIMIARQQGYDIRINSSYRDFPGQMDVFCNAFVNAGRAPASGAIATPGNSNHGRGQAVDAFLYTKDGKKILTLYGYSDKKQCDSDPQYVKKIADIFYAADKEFNRLETEIWHFEYGAGAGGGTSDKHDKLPKYCGK